MEKLSDSAIEEIIKSRFPFFESGHRTAISEVGIFIEFKENQEVVSRLLKQMEKGGLGNLSRGLIDYFPLCGKR